MNHWSTHLLEHGSSDIPLTELLENLFTQQRDSWELFRNGEAALSGIQTKRFTMNSSDIIVQSNPGRAVSTNAKVDPVSIAERPCFLCPDSLPPQERGIAFGKYIILPNPFPILAKHVTIAFTEHIPQECEPRIDDLLSLTEALGPSMFLLYNGPRCGASAPDHMHFQACSAENIPLFSHFPDIAGENRFAAGSLWGRNLVAGLFDNKETAAQALRKVLGALSDVSEAGEEPMCNIIATCRHNRFHVTFFPRAKHRSACYFADAEQRLSISPAAVEMAGIVVVADTSHFDRVDEQAVLAMYREVTLDDNLFARFAENAL